MASFASYATTCGARKHAWTKIYLHIKHIYFDNVESTQTVPNNNQAEFHPSRPSKKKVKVQLLMS